MKFFTVFFTVLLFITSFDVVKADEDIYRLVDSSNGKLIEEYENYKIAIRNFNKLKDEYDNLTLLKNDKVIETEYAIVSFNTNEGCSLQLEYQDNNYINGCYASDGVYLYSEYDEVYFMVSGAIGHSDNRNLTIIPVDSHPNNTSVYENINGVLFHNIKTDINSPYYTYSIELDESPEYLLEGNTYYSYDGHYFYNDFYEMVDGILSDNHDSAINDEVYYNFYQYLPFRSESVYEYDEINRYLLEGLGINAKLTSYNDSNGDNANDLVNRSQYYNELKAFFVAESVYGINALSLLSISMYESNYGKSLSAYLDNSLFKNAAFLNNRETNLKKYESLENSIYSFARYYLSLKYCNTLKNSYNGGFLGNKVAGMNVDYSNDPYYGEKVASIFYKIDKSLGYREKNNQCIALFNDGITLYSDSSLSTKIYNNDNIRDFTCIVLSEESDAYKILYDRCIDVDYLYKRDVNIAYIKKDATSLINIDKMHDETYQEYHYDLNGGILGTNRNLVATTSKQQIEPVPYKDGYEFIGYEDGKAEYLKISSISLTSGLDEEYGSKDYPIFKGEILVRYEDGSHAYVDLTSEMLRSFDYDTGKVEISYNGVNLEVAINKKDDLKIIEEVNAKYEKLCDEYKTSGTYSLSDFEYIKENINYLNVDFEGIRLLDKIAEENNNGYPVIYIEDNDYDLAFSGLSLAFNFEKTKTNSQLYDDTYYVKVNEVSSVKLNTLKQYGEYYGFNYEGSVELSFGYNLNSVKPASEIVVEAKLPNKNSNSIYTVYKLTDDGDIKKIKTTQTSSYIQFVIDNEGSYIFLSKPSVNTYIISDIRENISSFNNGVDSFSIMVEIMVFFIMMLYIFISFIIYFRLKNLNDKIWNRYYKMLRSMRN